MKVTSILGLNARSQLFSYQRNTKLGKKIADSKILTHRALKKIDVAHPRIYKIFREPKDIIEFDWSTLPDAFALKPSRGLGGDGIIVVKKRSKIHDGWITTGKAIVTPDDLKIHVLDILEGAYSKGNAPDTAFIQEYVGRHRAFRKYAFRGTPDVRIIVFNKVPVMAMLRLPTKESGGRANLHQGAIGVGIDITTGITTRAIWHAQEIKYKPGTKRKLNGMKIPHWDTILDMAANCSNIEGLGYMGVDIVLHPDKGPMVLELNAQPGLQIQIANMTGLKKRLEKVEDLTVKSTSQGVRIAKALFSASFSDRVKAREANKIVSIFEDVKILSAKKKKVTVRAKVDSGAWRTSIDHELAESLGLLDKRNILWEKKFKSALGTQKRTIIGITMWIKGHKIDTIASITNRKSLKFKLIIGRKDVSGFLINPRNI